MPLYKTLIFLILLLVSRSSILYFSYYLFLFLRFLLASHLILFRLCTLFWYGFCNHCILAYFLWYKNHKNSSSNHGLCCFNSYRPRLFCLIFSQALFMSSSSIKLSKAAKLSEFLIWYCFLTSSSFSFLRLNLAASNFCTACTVAANVSLNFQPPDSDQYHSQLPLNFVHVAYSNAISYLSICDQSGCESSHQERSRCTDV